MNVQLRVKIHYLKRQSATFFVKINIFYSELKIALILFHMNCIIIRVDVLCNSLLCQCFLTLLNHRPAANTNSDTVLIFRADDLCDMFADSCFKAAQSIRTSCPGVTRRIWPTQTDDVRLTLFCPLLYARDTAAPYALIHVCTQHPCLNRLMLLLTA